MTATPGLPKLNADQHEKLLLLSLLPLCRSPSSLSYGNLQTALFLDSIRALESLVTTAVYVNLITAHLDPLYQTVRVTSVAPLRDLPPGVLPEMTDLMQEWEARCVGTLESIEAQIMGIRRKAYDERARQEGDDAMFDAQLARIEERKPGEGPGAGQGSKKGGMTGKLTSLLSGKGGKRSAPGDQGLAKSKGADEAMDIDEGPSANAGLRSSKRKGFGMR